MYMYVASHKDSPGNPTKTSRVKPSSFSEHWSWNPTNSLQNTFRSNLHELRNPFWVDYYLAHTTTTNFYGQPMFESGNICDQELLQNARTHGPRGIVKTIEKLVLHRTQVHYFCTGNSNRDVFGSYNRYYQIETYICLIVKSFAGNQFIMPAILHWCNMVKPAGLLNKKFEKNMRTKNHCRLWHWMT